MFFSIFVSSYIWQWRREAGEKPETSMLPWDNRKTVIIWEIVQACLQAQGWTAWFSEPDPQYSEYDLWVGDFLRPM